MIRETGARDQESLRQHPSMQNMQMFPFPLTGIISAIKFTDAINNTTQQTLVDINLHQGYGALIDVPLSAGKANGHSGEEWTPDMGDMVIVQFIGGRWTKPLVTGYCNTPNNKLQAKKIDVPANSRRYHFRCNRADLKIDKDGNRITYIDENEILEVSKKASLTVLTDDYVITIEKGKLEINVQENDANITIKGNTSILTEGDTKIETKGISEIITTGNASITTQGVLNLEAKSDCNIISKAKVVVNSTSDTEVNSSGKIAIKSTGKTTVTAKKIELDGGSGKPAGVVTQSCLCSFTGRPHSDYSLDVIASRG